MDLQQPLPQSADVPYVTVARDERGCACWMVVCGDVSVPTASGARAIEICEAMRRAKGLPSPGT
jgi:hypothetical protein